MVTGSAREGTLGFATYLLVAAAIAVTFMLGGSVVGSDMLQDRVSFPSLGEAFDDGSAYTTVVLAFFVTIPIVTAGVAALFGRRAALTGQSLRGQAALNALVGVPVSYIVLVLGMVITSALAGEDGQRSALSAVMDISIEGFVMMLLALGPLVGFAALVAHVVQEVFETQGLGVFAESGRHGYDDGHDHGHDHHHGHDHDDHDHHHDWPDDDHVEHGDHVHPGHETHHVGHDVHGGGHVPAHDHVHEMHIDCPRCGTEFIAEGERPMRIACPNCGKSGTIR